MRIARLSWPWCAAVLVLAGCGDRALDPQRNSSDARGVVVSEAVSAPVGRPVTWVSLPPGSVSDAARATITTSHAGGQVIAPMVEGGFDPVAVAADPGDTVAVVFTGAAGAAVGTASIVVPLLKPPVIVRTDPPKRKRDVPLNQRMRVIFSEPMDPRSITGTTVRLLRGGVAVAGSVALSAEGWLAEFEPDQPLSGQTDYVLQISTGATDLAGDPLAEALSVEFTTEPSVVARVEVLPDSATLLIGAGLVLEARVRDQGGNLLSGSVEWRSSDSTIATVDGGGAVRGIASGATTISARSEAVVGTARLRIVAAAALGVGEYHTCALDSDGRTYCWGNDYQGHLGVPANDQCSLFVGSRKQGIDADGSCLTVASQLPAAQRFTALAAGEFFTCGLSADGTAYCWGLGAAGSLGDGNAGYHVSTTPTAVVGGHAFTMLTAGASHACGLTAGGQAYCWGSNSNGEIGDETLTDRGAPVQVSGAHTFTSIRAFWSHTCGVDSQGQGWCWGSNFSGELGTGRTGGVEITPAAVDGSVRFVTIEPGFSHTCGLAADGTAYCWGKGAGGALGTGNDTSDVATPVPVATALRFSRLDAGLEFTCAIGFADRAAYCWGRQPGPTYLEGEAVLTPTLALPVSGVEVAVLGLGQRYACGITPAGRTRCWGEDNAAQTRPFMRP